VRGRLNPPYSIFLWNWNSCARCDAEHKRRSRDGREADGSASTPGAP